MKFSSVFTLLLFNSPALAFPWRDADAMNRLINHPKVQEDLRRYFNGVSPPDQKRQVNGVMDPEIGLIPQDSAVQGLKKFPEDEYPFIAPNATDQRGPCPGLNTMANHGYIPRNGIATVLQIIAGSLRVFNMSPDLSGALCVSVFHAGNILTQTMSIGGPDNRVAGPYSSILGTPSGAAGHGKFVESDASATRNDYYPSLDDSTFQPDLFQLMHQLALAIGGGAYNRAVVKEHFKRRYEDCKANNPKFYFNPPSAISTMGAYSLIYAGFSNGTFGNGGIPNEASVTSFYGARPTRPRAWDDPNLTYERVPERIPPNWYRRETPITSAEILVNALELYTFAQPQFGGNDPNGVFVAGPVSIPTSQQGFACFFYNAIYANFPSQLFNVVLVAQTVLNFVYGLVSPGAQALGCGIQVPASTMSSAAYDAWSETYVGKAKKDAVGSGWYQQ